MASSANRDASRSSFLTSPLSLLTRLSSYLTFVPRPLLVTVTFLTSSYFLTTVLLSHLLSIHNRINAQSSSKEGLRSKFQRNLQDVQFTILALLPSLKAGMDKAMDLDAITRELRNVGKEEQGDTTVQTVGKNDTAEPTKGDVVNTATAPSQPPTPVLAETDEQSNSTQTQQPSPPSSALDAISEPRPDPIAPQATLNGDHRTETPQTHEGNGQVDSAEVQELGKDASETSVKETPRYEPTSADEASLTATKEEDQIVVGNGEKEPEERRISVGHSQALTANASSDKDVDRSDDLTAQLGKEQPLGIVASEMSRDTPSSSLLVMQRQQQLTQDRKRKAALWQQLKVLTFTRALTAIYAVAFLSVLTHVQLNVLGRYSYLRDLAGLDLKQADKEEQTNTSADPFEEAWASANGGVKADASSFEGPSFSTGSAGRSTLSTETEERYLTFSYHFLHQGWKELGERVKEKVEEVMSSVPLKAQLSHEELTSIVRKIRRRIEYEYETEDAESGVDIERKESSSVTSPRPSVHVRPYTFPGGHTLEGAKSSSCMAFGSESLLPRNGFHDGLAEDGSKSEAGSCSVMSGSTTLSVTTNGHGEGGRGSIGTRGGRRKRRKRLDMLRAFLLPTTAEGDLSLLTSAGLVPRDLSLLQEVDVPLANLLDETRDLLECSDAQDVSKRCIDDCFQKHLLDSLRPSFGLGPHVSPPTFDTIETGTTERRRDGVPPRSGSQGRFSEITSEDQEAEIRNDPSMTVGRRLKLAGILPLLAGRGEVVLGAMPNEIVETIASNKDLQAFSAIIYASFTS